MDEPTQYLGSEQTAQPVELMRSYLTAPADSDGRTPLQIETELDQRRVDVIERELKPLLQDYLSDRVSLPDFKTKVDGINKRNQLWGFRGAKGQMFFNVLFNATEDRNECDERIKAAVAEPKNETDASGRIRSFIDYVNKVGDRQMQSGGARQGRPNSNSVPFFVSYFWQIQERSIWPTFYTNSVNVMTDMNLWVPTGELAADYITYKQIHEELGRVFTREGRRNFGLYEVEHVFWSKGGNPYGKASPAVPKGRSESTALSETAIRLPESYVPPIVDILPRLARNEGACAKRPRPLGRAWSAPLRRASTPLLPYLVTKRSCLGKEREGCPMVKPWITMTLMQFFGMPRRVAIATPWELMTER